MKGRPLCCSAAAVCQNKARGTRTTAEVWLSLKGRQRTKTLRLVGVRSPCLGAWTVNEEDSWQSNSTERLSGERILGLRMRSQHRYGDIKIHEQHENQLGNLKGRKKKQLLILFLN